jgi:hypothetical protein
MREIRLSGSMRGGACNGALTTSVGSSSSTALPAYSTVSKSEGQFRRAAVSRSHKFQGGGRHAGAGHGVAPSTIPPRVHLMRAAVAATWPHYVRQA